MNCGIYKITNINGKVYIGSSVNIKQRLKNHVYCFRNNKHYNSYLQRSWNKSGEESFIFEVLLYCAEENLLFYEDRAIDEYKSLDGEFGYNIRPAERRDLTGDNYDKWVQNLSKATKGKNNPMYGRIGKNHPQAKLVKTKSQKYDTIKEAAQALGITAGALSRRLKKGIDVNKEVISHPKGKDHPTARAVIINGKQYNTITVAAKDLGISISTLWYRLKNKTNTNKLISMTGKNHPLAKLVIANYKQYDTITEAAKDLKVCRQTIINRIKTNKLGYRQL